MVLAAGRNINWKNDDDVVFSGPRIGVKRLHGIVKSKLESKSVMKRNTKAGTSHHILKKLFKQFDKDKSGTIDRDEFYSLLKAIGLQNINKNDASDLFNRYDKDKNGSLDFGEWCSIYGISNHISHAPGIIDLPSTKNDALMAKKSHDERVFLLRRDFASKMRDNHISATAVFVECAGSVTGLAIRETIKHVLRGKYAIGIGNERAMDALLDSFCTQGSLNFDAFQSCFGSVKRNQKYREARELFVGAPIGVERLHNLVSTKMVKNSYRRGVVKAISSAHVLRRLFQEFDKDRNGSIDYEEFKVMVAERLGINAVHENDVKALFKKYDGDGNGSIDYDEFTTIFCDQFSNERGIIDLPSTRQDNKHAQMNPKQAQTQLSIDVIKTLTDCTMTAQQLFRLCCRQGANATTSKQIKAVLRGKFGVGLGNEDTMDRVLAKAAAATGRIGFQEFADALQLRSEMAKRIQDRQQVRRRNSQVARGLGGPAPFAGDAAPAPGPATEQGGEFRVVTSARGPKLAQKPAPASDGYIDWSDVLQAQVKTANPATDDNVDARQALVVQTERGHVAEENANPNQATAKLSKTARVRPSTANSTVHRIVPCRPTPSRPPTGTKGVVRRNSMGGYKGRNVWLNVDRPAQQPQQTMSQAIGRATAVARANSRARRLSSQ